MISNFVPILGFGKNGRLFKNFEEYKALSTLNICLMVVSLMVILAFTYYFLQFRKREGEARYFNKKLVGLTTGLLAGSTLFWILNFIFYYSAEKVFKTPLLAQNVMISFLVIGFLFIFCSMVLIWFKIPYYGVVISQDKFWFLGENLDFSKVIKVITDDQSKALYINYAASNRLFKYYRLRLNSGSAKFLLENLPSSLVVEAGNQTEYFKELTKTLPQQEK